MERKFKGIRCEGLDLVLLARIGNEAASTKGKHSVAIFPYQVCSILRTDLQHKHRRILSQNHKVCSSITQMSGPKYQSVLLFYFIFVINFLPKHGFCMH